MTRCPNCDAMVETLRRCSTCLDQGCNDEDCIFEDDDDECHMCQGGSKTDDWPTGEDLDNLDDVEEGDGDKQ